MNPKYLLTMIPLLLESFPIGMEIEAGACDVSHNESSMHLAAADQSVLNWIDFSIQNGECVEFALPDQQSVVLNRVKGPNPSEIFGKLSCNGKLVLMNANGILFGKESQINVHNLTASSLKTIEHFGEIRSSGGSIELKADRVIVHHRASLNADGVGDGGQITLFGEKFVQMAGHMSAQGGKACGNGGRLEISTHGQLDFPGTVSTIAPHGITGELVLDPLDLTVVAPNLNVTGATPFMPTGAGATLDPASVVAALAGTNVTITTVGTVGPNLGNITVQTPIAWAVGTNTLTINAANDIFIQANVTSTPANASINLIAGGAIQLADGILVQGAGANANMTLTANGNINIFGAVRNNEFATSAGGAINITSATGNINIGRAASVSTPSGAVANIFGQINVSAPRGNINLLGGSIANSCAIIGNDNNFYTVAPATSVGNILIQAQNFTMAAGSNLSTMVSVSRLPISPVGFPIMNNSVVGNITINAAQDITLQTGTARQNSAIGRADGAFIGHGNGGGYVAPANVAVSRIGNILINAGRDLNMISSFFTIITSGDPTSLTSIGTNRVTSAVAPYRGSITVNVGRDLSMTGLPNSCRLNGNSIGTLSTSLLADTRNYQVPLYINVGRDMCLDARLTPALIGTHNNSADPTLPADFFIHVGRNMVLFAGNGARVDPGAVPLGGAFALIRHFPPANNGRYQAWAGGSIVCLNGFGAAGGGFAELHLPASFQGAAANQRVLYDISVRAAGDIRVAGGLVQAGVTYSSIGGIFYQADSPFAQGEMWPAQTVMVNGVNIFAGTPLGTASNALNSNGSGAIAFDFQRYDNTNFSCLTLTGNIANPNFPVAIPIVYQAHFGQDITMLTTDRFTSGAFADLTTGTGNGQISFNNSIRTTAQQNSLNVAGGNIRIVNFRNTTITGASLTAPAGNILAVTNNNMSLMANANITASGLVTLVADNQAPVPTLIGPGGFSMDQTSQINSGPGQAIRIFTAIPAQNSISLLALINGQTIGAIAANFGVAGFPGTPFLTNNFLETWCTYYNVPPGNIYQGSPLVGIPFMIFYKPCLQVIVEQAMVVVDQLLVDLHPYNEFPGWMQRFLFEWQVNDAPDEPFYFRRRNLNHLNHPKSYTLLMLQ